MSLTKNVLNEDHPVIDGILGSNRITGETKLLAVSELLALQDRVNNGGVVRPAHEDMPFPSEYADDIDELFEWEDSELGVGFWAKIQDEVFEADKRSC